MTRRLSHLSAARLPCRAAAFVTLVAALCSPPPATAETIELWQGAKAENVEVVRVEDGILYFIDDGKERRVKLDQVKSILRPETDRIKLLDLDRTEDRRRVYYTLGMAIESDSARMSEPLVRVFVMDADERGAYSVQLYTSRRNADPTLLNDVPDVDGDAYAQRYWEVNTDRPVAWHIEVWLDGKLAWDFDRRRDGLNAPEDWWRRADLRRASIMRELEAPQAEVAAIRDPLKEKLPPPVAVQISGAGSHLDTRTDTLTFRVNYTLRSIHVQEVEEPTVTAYLLSEGADKRRRVTKLEMGGGGDAKLQANMATDSLEVAMPDAITHGLDTGRNEGEIPEKLRQDRLLAWRVEAKYGETVVAFKLQGPADLLSSLPDNWYK